MDTIKYNNREFEIDHYSRLGAIGGCNTNDHGDPGEESRPEIIEDIKLSYTFKSGNLKGIKFILKNPPENLYQDAEEYILKA